jgi:putative transcriptional regulator
LTSEPARGIIRMESELVMTPNVRNRIRELRLERGWTQQELADAVGVSRQSINSIECNRYVPSLPLALAFARVFRRATDDLFRLEGKP